MNDREIFDTVKNHLLTQNKKSVDGSSGACLYRGPNGTKCAIGCLISDKHYTLDLERKSVDHNSVVAALILSGVKFSEKVSYFLRFLQECHDDYEVWEWKKILDKIEKIYFE